jgi:hypothetical protein
MFFAIDYNYNTKEWAARKCERYLWEYWYMRENDIGLCDRLIYVSF